MFVQTIINGGIFYFICREDRADVMNVTDSEIYDFTSVTSDEIREYEEYLREQLERVEIAKIELHKRLKHREEILNGKSKE